MGVTSTFRFKGTYYIDMSGWDYVVVQVMPGSILVNIGITNDGGAVEGSIDDASITADISNTFPAYEVKDISTGTIATLPASSGLYKIQNISRYVLIEANANDQEFISMLYKKM